MTQFNNIITIIGLTNVGKSYLYNKILNKFKSMLTIKNFFTYDLIFSFFDLKKNKNLIIDTPGYRNNVINYFNKITKKKIFLSIDLSNIIIYVTKNNRDRRDLCFLKKIKKKLYKKKFFLVVLNKDKSKVSSIYLKFFKISQILIVETPKNIKKNLYNILGESLNNKKVLNYTYFNFRNYFLRDIVRLFIYKNYKKEIPYSIFIYLIKVFKNNNNYSILIKLAIESESKKKIFLGYNDNRISTLKNEVIDFLNKIYKIKIVSLDFIIKTLKWKNNKFFLKKYYN